MRKALLFGVTALAACKPTEHAPAEPSASSVPNDDSRREPTETSSSSPPEKPAPEPSIASPAASPVGLGHRFRAIGTEPFWTVEIVGPGKIQYRSPENQKGTTFAYAIAINAAGYRYNGILDGQAFSLMIAKGTCSDGMSDRVYKWKATLTIDGKTEQGCAVQK